MIQRLTKGKGRTEPDGDSCYTSKPGAISQEISIEVNRSSVEIVEIPRQERAALIENDGEIDATDKELEGVSFFEEWDGRKEREAERRSSGGSRQRSLTAESLRSQ